jgi:hypothetical protein
MKANLFGGSNEWMGLQLSNTLGWKIPQLEQCQIQRKCSRWIIQSDQEAVLLGNGILKEHAPVFQLPNALIQDPVATSWWHVYDKHAIMKHRHGLNTSIPESVDEAEFPPERWLSRYTCPN